MYWIRFVFISKNIEHGKQGNLSKNITAIIGVFFILFGLRLGYMRIINMRIIFFVFFRNYKGDLKTRVFIFIFWMRESLIKKVNLYYPFCVGDENIILSFDLNTRYALKTPKNKISKTIMSKKKCRNKKSKRKMSKNKYRKINVER